MAPIFVRAAIGYDVEKREEGTGSDERRSYQDSNSPLGVLLRALWQ